MIASFVQIKRCIGVSPGVVGPLHFLQKKFPKMHNELVKGISDNYFY